MNIPVPEYQVQLATHLAIGILQWTPARREGFLKESEALGSAPETRDLRRYGGSGIWLIHGSYHMTYTVDAKALLISVTAAKPCLHHSREECFQ